MCTRSKIHSVPAIRLYGPAGTMPWAYRGPRRAAAIIAYLRRMQQPPVSTLDERNATSFVSADHVVFLSHIAAGDEDLPARFRSVADKYRDRFSFATMATEERQSFLSCYNNADDVQQSTVELDRVEALEHFVKACSTPLIPELTRRNEMEYYAVSVRNPTPLVTRCPMDMLG
jgi:protein disulfide-isomerase A1